MPPPFRCTYCDKQFPKKFNLNRHVKNLHKKAPGKNTQGTYGCSICLVVFNTRESFVNHCSSSHDIAIKTETLHFDNEENFNKWKTETEKKSKTCFIIRNSDVRNHNGPISKRSQYVCNRSGVYRGVGETRKREIKIQGSRKLNGFCPCGLKVKFFTDGKINVEYCSTHIGHKTEFAHLPLTFEERQDVATQLANKIPLDTVLGKVRSTIKKQELERVHLLTKKDLYNIEGEFNLNETVRHSNDAVSVDAWVEEERKSDRNSVLMYKPQGEIDTEYNTFKTDDFALGIMTNAQEEILKKFGNDCICMDGTHGLNKYNFEVVTLMVLDDMRQGFPCAFFICSRIDSQTIATFLASVKDKVGELRPSVFMSDMAESFYNGWLTIMNPVEKRLFCTWHVDRAWQNNLSKIRDKETKGFVYKKLRVLLEETDESAFLTMLPSITETLIDDFSTNEFGQYFSKYYGSCYKSWAYCYRVNAGINTNMHLESMHRAIKHIYLKGKTCQRLDKSLNALMELVQHKLFDRLTTLEKGGKITSKLRDLRIRHKKSLEMDENLIVQKVDSSCWEVSASSGTEVYTVHTADTKCKCDIACKHCASCIHKYRCSCIDSSIKWNMCKHIHLLCRKLKCLKPTAVSATAENEEELDTDEVLHIEEDVNMAEKVAILEEVGVAEVDLIEKQKMDLIEGFRTTINQLTSVDCLKLGQETLKTFRAKLKAIEKCASFPVVSSKTSHPHNKKIEKQRRFLSLKKQRKSKESKRPSKEEAQTIALEALGTLSTPGISIGTGL